jgi:FAD-linked sulfhydryl oxidase
MEMGIKESSEENCGEPVCRNESALEAEQNSWKASGSIGESKSNENCPLSKQSLGRHSWPLLHTMAAYYPKTPSEKE